MKSMQEETQEKFCSDQEPQQVDCDQYQRANRHSKKKTKIAKKSRKQKVDDEWENKRKEMLKNSLKIINNQEVDYWPSLSMTQVGVIRRNYCNQILKYLLFGYQQLSQEIIQKVSYNEQWLIPVRTLDFYEKYQTLENSINNLVQLVTQIQSEMFEQYRNISFDVQQIQPRKYNFQMKRLIFNLRDAYNSKLRQQIMVGILPPKIICCMDQIEMLQPNKRMFILTKNKSLLSHKLKKRRPINISEKRQDYHKIGENTQNDNKQKALGIDKGSNLQTLQNKKLNYFLSKQFNDRLESQLMEIPDKMHRKKALQHLNDILSGQ